MKSTKETWKPIVGYEGVYEVSDLGRVKRLPRERENKLTGGVSSYKEKILNPTIFSNGYCVVDLSYLGSRKKFLVHRIVAESFIENSNNYEQVNHLNGIKTDNRLENLEWCDRSRNQKHSIEKGLRSAKGENNSQSKLTVNDVLEIKKLIDSKKHLLKEIAKMYNVSLITISDIKRRKTWKHII